ncbi:hypothetical protein Tco_0945419, partial [Tanacetum coccineum]
MHLLGLLIRCKFEWLFVGGNLDFLVDTEKHPSPLLCTSLLDSSVGRNDGTMNTKSSYVDGAGLQNHLRGIATRVNLEESCAKCDGSPKVCNSSPLVSLTATINMPRGLYNVDVAATFGVSLTTVVDLRMLIKCIKDDKHDELLSRMTNDDRMVILDALGTICNSIKADNTNADVIPCKVSHVDDSTIAENLNVDDSTLPSDPIVQSMDINTKSTSYSRATGASTKDQPKVNSNFCPLVADPVFDGVNISIPRKVVKKEQLGKTWAEKDYDKFQ